MPEHFAKTPKAMPTSSKTSLPQNLLKSINSTKSTIKKFYAQASKINVKDIIHIKDTFLTLTLKKIIEVNNVINKLYIVKPKIKITTKGPLRKQIIVPISKSNSNIIRSNVSFHINTINRYLKEANSNNMANFLHIDKVSIIITISQTISFQDIKTIKKAIKNSKKINKDFIQSS